MDERLIKTGKFLEDIASDPSKLECLKCFAMSQEVIKWLREVTNGKLPLQFVMYSFVKATKSALISRCE